MSDIDDVDDLCNKDQSSVDEWWNTVIYDAERDGILDAELRELLTHGKDLSNDALAWMRDLSSWACGNSGGARLLVGILRRVSTEFGLNADELLDRMASAIPK